MTSVPPGHHVPVSDGWMMWRWVCLRSAGFPADTVLALATTDVVAAADRVLVAERGRTGAEAAEARREYAWRWTAAHRAARGRLRAAVCEPRIREALLWQNRRAWHGGISALLRKDLDATDFKTRQNEALVASYLQRYCVKNDSIGFFGPVAWAEWCDEHEISVRSGPQVVSPPEIFFEPWAVQAVADHLSALPALRPWCAPRLVPTVRLEGRQLHHPPDRQTSLPPAYAAALALADGRRSARAIAGRLCADPSLGLRHEDEVMALFAQLADKNVVIWKFELPPGELRPERRLGHLIEGIAEESARKTAASPLEVLEATRRKIAACSGEPDRLDAALADLDETFTRLTGSPPTRRAGAAYAGRTLVYPECRRDVDLRLGKLLRDRLSPPLALLLQSARWYTYEVARRYRARFEATYRDLRTSLGADRVDYLRFFAAVEPLFAPNQYQCPPLVREVVDELQSRWARLFAIEPGERWIRREPSVLSAGVARAFEAPGPGWPGARFHSPDLLIAAASADAATRGDFLLVMGELHAGWNTFSVPVFLEQHPKPFELRRAHDLDLPSPRVFPVEPAGQATRIFQALLGSHDFELETGPTPSRLPPERVLRAADLVVERRGAALEVVAPARNLRFDVVAFLESYLLLDSMAHFRLLPAASYTPRVSIGALVVARESWTFERAQLPFLAEEALDSRFLAVRRWVVDHRLPRFMFIKTPAEPKPCYVDFDSTTFVELFVRFARRSPSISLSEMLPDVGQTFLTDRAGRTYTSELRLAVLDPQPWAAPPAETRSVDVR